MVNFNLLLLFCSYDQQKDITHKESKQTNPFFSSFQMNKRFIDVLNGQFNKPNSKILIAQINKRTHWNRQNRLKFFLNNFYHLQWKTFYLKRNYIFVFILGVDFTLFLSCKAVGTRLVKQCYKIDKILHFPEDKF